MGDDEPGFGGSEAADDGGAGGGESPTRRVRDASEAAAGFRQWVSRPEVLVGLSAVVLSLCGLFISIHETMLVREEQRASVWPHVAVGTSFDASSVSFHVRNNGVGPARVGAAAVEHGGEPLDDWKELMQRVADGPVTVLGWTRNLINGGVLGPGSSRETIFELEDDEVEGAVDLVGTLQEAILDGSVDVTVCYCSVYGECWTSSLQEVMRASRGEAPPAGASEVENCEGAARSGI